MNDLEQLLLELGRELNYPPTPDIGPPVIERIRNHAAPRRVPTRRAISIAVATLLLVTTGAIAAVPSARHTVLRWLGLRSVQIERVPAVPKAPPTSTTGIGPELGRQSTLVGARASVHFQVLIPRLGTFEAPRVYLSHSPPGGRVTLLYVAGPGFPAAAGTGAGLLITEFRGDQPREFLGKTLGPGTTAAQLRIKGEPAVWIAGQPHLVVFRDVEGTIRVDPLRLATNTLLWHHGKLLIRIEAHVSEAVALRIAGSMR